MIHLFDLILEIRRCYNIYFETRVKREILIKYEERERERERERVRERENYGD